MIKFIKKYINKCCEFYNKLILQIYYSKIIKNSLLSDKVQVYVAGEGAVTEFAINTYSKMTDKFQIYADVKNKKQLDLLNIQFKNTNILPLIHRLDDSNATKLIYIGNSFHYSNLYNLALKSKNKNKCWLVLPDVITIGAIKFKKGENLKKAILKYYPELISDISSFNKKDPYKFLIKHKICLLRYLIKQTKINNIISFGDKSKHTVEKDLKNTNINVNLKIIKIPYEKINFKETYSPLKNKEASIYLGTFGIPENTFKRTNTIIDAVNILVKDGFSIKLIMAGYGVNSYLNNIVNKKNIISIDNPSKYDWYKIMNSVDIAIQLRENAFAFSSGCISELVGLGKKIVITQHMLGKDWETSCYNISENLNSKELANEIKKALTLNINYNNSLYVKDAFSDMVKQLIYLINN